MKIIMIIVLIIQEVILKQIIKKKKIIKRNLKLNESLSKEIQDITQKNQKSTINYEKILDKYEHPIELNSQQILICK